jgi:hypothetical protein
MPPSPERSQRARETLLFAQPEQAQAFAHEVGEKLQRQQGDTVRRDREIVGEAVAQQFDAAGEVTSSLREPWEHTAAEHEEVQKLVDVTFARDLSAALRVARQSDTYPRNIDLFHDLLTGELYQLVQQHKLNRQPLGGWGLAAAGAVIGALLVALGALIFLSP